MKEDNGMDDHILLKKAAEDRYLHNIDNEHLLLKYQVDLDDVDKTAQEMGIYNPAIISKENFILQEAPPKTGGKSNVLIMKTDDLLPEAGIIDDISRPSSMQMELVNLIHKEIARTHHELTIKSSDILGDAFPEKARYDITKEIINNIPPRLPKEVFEEIKKGISVSLRTPTSLGDVTIDSFDYMEEAVEEDKMVIAQNDIQQFIISSVVPAIYITLRTLPRDDPRRIKIVALMLKNASILDYERVVMQTREKVSLPSNSILDEIIEEDDKLTTIIDSAIIDKNIEELITIDQIEQELSIVIDKYIEYINEIMEDAAKKFNLLDKDEYKANVLLKYIDFARSADLPELFIAQSDIDRLYAAGISD